MDVTSGIFTSPFEWKAYDLKGFLCVRWFILSVIVIDFSSWTASASYQNEEHIYLLPSFWLFSQQMKFAFWSFYLLVSSKAVRLVKILQFASIPKLSLLSTPPLVGEKSQQKGAWQSWQQSCFRDNSLTLAPDRCSVASQPLLSGDPRAPLQRKPRD